MTNVHGHRQDPTSLVDLVKVHEELVRMTVLTRPHGGPDEVSDVSGNDS